MLTYKYHSGTKEFLYAEEAFLDPLETELQEKEIYLLPTDSTFTEPIEPKEGYAVCWNGEAWEHIPDHRQKRDQGGVIVEGSGTPFWLPGDTWETPARYMVELGELPEGAILEQPKKPQPTLDELKQAAYLVVDEATSKAILAGFDCMSDPGTGEAETLHFSYDNFDQQNFADTANACLLAQGGVGCLPSAVMWNGYRNYTADGGGELVRLSLDVSAFLTLYTGGALAHKAAQMEIGGQRKAMIQAATSKAEIDTLFEEWGLLEDVVA